MEKYSIGIEFGSTRIKAVLIDEKFSILASGIYNWENQLVDNIWTYSKAEMLNGLKVCINNLRDNYGKDFPKNTSLGISGMMHGYIALDKNDNFLVPFRTWRNTNALKAAKELSSMFNFNVPMRWSISQLYQSMLDKEEHVKNITYVTTLAGYIHYLLTGKKVLGVGDASGMFPIDIYKKTYDQNMVNKFNELLHVYGLELEDIFPQVLYAKEDAGSLTEEGAKLIDNLLPIGTKLCPPEGDAGTGMIATNSIKETTGNISAGTSIFAMIVMQDNLSKPYEQIDVVTTPHGKNVAMVHCNNCTSDINAWVHLFKDVLNIFDCSVSDKELYSKLFLLALNGDRKSGDLINYNFVSGEPIVNCNSGKPLFVRNNDSVLSLPNFMKSIILSSFASLSIGLEILKKEKMKINQIYGHGGLFNSKEVTGRFMSSAINAPITIMETANEGGSWGIAILAMYLNSNETSLESFMDQVFKDSKSITVKATRTDKQDFKYYLKQYKKFLKAERTADKINF